MAEVSCRLGPRALRISGLSATKVKHTVDVAKACATAVSSTIADGSEHEYLSERTASEVRQAPAKGNGEQPSLEDFDYTRRLSDGQEFENSSDASLPHNFTGYHASFFDERSKSLQVCSKQQSSHTDFGHKRLPAFVGSHSCVQRVSVWCDRQLQRGRLSGKMHPVQRLRMFSALVLHADPHTRLLYSLTVLRPLHLWTCSRAYSWKKDNRSTQPLFRSRTAYYDILQVTPNATQAQIKTAYYKQSFIFHPDKNAGSEEATRRFAEISEAYMVLGSKWLRRKYDNGLLNQADLQSSSRPSAKDPATARPPGQQRQRAHTHGAASAGSQVHYDFDAFYQAHYGEQLQREQEMRRRREVLQRLRQEEWKKFRRKRMTEVSVTVLLTVAGIILISLIES